MKDEYEVEEKEEYGGSLLYRIDTWVSCFSLAPCCLLFFVLLQQHGISFIILTYPLLITHYSLLQYIHNTVE